MLKPEKIFIVCSSYYPDVKGGGEISTKLLAESLLRQGIDLEVVTFTNKEDHISNVDGVIVNRLHHKNIYWSYDKGRRSKVAKLIWHAIDRNNAFSANRIISLAKKKQVTHIITSTIEDVSTATWRLANKNGLTVTHILRSYTLLCPNATMFKKGKNCDRQCSACALFSNSKKCNSQFVNNVVGISKFILDRHTDAGFFNHANQHVIPNICSSNAELAVGGSISIKRKSDVLRLGYLGNILSTKGIDSLIKAIAGTEHGRKIKLFIAGDGEHQIVDEYKNLAKSLSVDVQFMGHIKPSTLFSEIDFLVVPSRWHEPFGRIIIEAYEHRVPVIGRQVGGISELIVDERFLFQSDDDLSRVIDYLSSDDGICYIFPSVDYDAGSIASLWSEMILQN